MFFALATREAVSCPCSPPEAVLGPGSVCERGRGIRSPVHRQPRCKRPDLAHASRAPSREVQWLCAGSPQLSEIDVPSVPFGAWFQVSGDHRRHSWSPLFGGGRAAAAGATCWPIALLRQQPGPRFLNPEGLPLYLLRLLDRWELGLLVLSWDSGPSGDTSCVKGGSSHDGPSSWPSYTSLVL